MTPNENARIAKWLGHKTRTNAIYGAIEWFVDSDDEIGAWRTLPNFCAPAWVGPMLMKAFEKCWWVDSANDRAIRMSLPIAPHHEANGDGDTFPEAVCRAVLKIIELETK